MVEFAGIESSLRRGAGAYILHLNVKRDVPIIVIMVLKLA